MRVVIFLFLAIALLSLEVHSISVASDYLQGGTLELIEGTSKIYSIRLQNPTDDQVGLKLDYDAAFMKVIDYKEIYTLSPRETGYSILFNVTAPKKLGEYNVGYTVSEVEPAGGGGLPIRLKINRNFKLKIIKDPNKFHINYFASIYVAALLILGFALVKKILPKKQERKRKVNK